MISYVITFYNIKDVKNISEILKQKQKDVKNISESLNEIIKKEKEKIANETYNELV